MVLKEQQSLKNKWEKVIYLTSQKNYNKYTIQTDLIIDDTNQYNIKEYNITDNMEIYQKWSYYLFNKSQY
jgi:hypothetical protein